MAITICSQDNTMIKKLRYFIIGFVIFTSISAQWRSGPAMTTARSGLTAVVLDQKIFVIGGAETGRNGLKTVDIYNPDDGYWSQSVSTINYGRINASAVVFDGKIYLFGGSDKNALIPQIEQYDPLTNSWQTVGTMPSPREGLCTVAMDSCVWIMGGSAASQERIRIVERYYPHTNSWDTLSYELNTGRAGAVAGKYQGIIYLFGGHLVEPLSTIEKYVPGQGWISAGEMPYACGSAACVSTEDGIWIAGGQGNSGILNTVQSFRMDENIHWQAEKSLHTGRKDLALVEINNIIYAIGGNSGKGGQTSTNTVELFDILTAIPEIVKVPDTGKAMLISNYPNPFNSMTVIRVYLPVRTNVTINIYNILGENIRQVYNGSVDGWQHFLFDAKDKHGKSLPSGQYFLYLSSVNEKQVKKIILAK